MSMIALSARSASEFPASPSASLGASESGTDVADAAEEARLFLLRFLTLRGGISSSSSSDNIAPLTIRVRGALLGSSSDVERSGSARAGDLRLMPLCCDSKSDGTMMMN